MKKFLIFCVIVGVILWINYERDNDPDQRRYENSYSSSSTSTKSKEDAAYVGNSLSTGNSPYQSQQTAIENDPYYNNSLKTGAAPYANSALGSSYDSEIKVSTSANSNSDVVVIVKHNGEMVRNAYIKAGGSHTFQLPNGRYQVFFYAGKGWNPNKEMPNGGKGGFVANESYSKDSPVTLDNHILTYELIPQQNGNFSTLQSNANEVF
jgi:hypothetical protein